MSGEDRPELTINTSAAHSHPSAVPALTVTEAGAGGETTNEPAATPSPVEPNHLTSLALREHDPLTVYNQNQQQLSPRRSYYDGHARSPSGGSLASMASTVPDDSSHTAFGGSAPASPTPLKRKSLDLEAGHQRQASAGEPQQTSATRQHQSQHDAPTKADKKGVLGTLFFWRKAEIADADQAPEGEEAPLDPAQKIPDPSPEAMGPFKVKPSSLDNLFNPKSAENLEALGGVDGVVQSLHTSTKTGLSDQGGGEQGTTKEQRISAYGPNQLPQRKSKSLLELMWIAFQDKVLIILSVAAVVSLALGIYQTVGTPPEIINGEKQPHVEWVEGVAIMVAIFIVVTVGSLNDWQKELQFKKLNEKKEDRSVKCVRGGVEQLMSVHDVVVGDILMLEPGEIVPVDGLFLDGHNVKCDESSATGESDAIRKLSQHDLQQPGASKKADCFIISGSKVLEGSGRYVATSVGIHSSFGRIMLSMSNKESVPTPLQTKLNDLAELIAKLASLAGLILFIALFIKFCVGLHTNPNRTSDQKGQNFISVLIIAVTIIVVAVPEGLPLAVTVALAFATRRMTSQNLLVRVLSSCEIMANANVICTDKTGTLTQNKMSVVAGSIGVHCKFVESLAEHGDRVNANDDLKAEGGEAAEGQEAPSASAPPPRREGRLDFSADMADVSKIINPALRRLFNESVALNSNAFEGTDEHGNQGFVGSKTETALLAFCKEQGWEPYQQVRDSKEIVQALPFDSTRKASAVVAKLPNGKFRFYVKGASEILQKRSTKHVFIANPASRSFSDLDKKELENEDAQLKDVEFTDETRANVERTIIFYANQCLRTIALCYRDFSSWPPKEAEIGEDGDVVYDSICKDLTMLAITAIEDPLRPGVTNSVKACQGAGVAVKMCTGDNVLTARSIATQCGIYTAGGLIMEGPQFRKLSKEERRRVAPRLQVLARSSPDDKHDLVEALQAERHVVGVTGDGTNDGPALKLADVGFSMGIAGTEVAKEASDIILMDDNFSSIVTAIIWGRCVNDSVKKFLQFQLSVNICAVLVTFVSAVASSDESSVLTAVQLLWVNLIMDTFAALALATDPATTDSLKRQPEPKGSGLLSVDMWKMIIGQSIYQCIVALVLHFAGKHIFNAYSDDPARQLTLNQQISTLVFNTFVFCQVFNQLNARVLGRQFNVLAGFWRNYWFIAIFCIMVGGQTLIVFVGGAAFSVTRIPGKYWATSIVIGALSLPIGVIIRLIPNGPCIVIGNAFMKVWYSVGGALAKPFRSLAYALHLKKRPEMIEDGDEEHAMDDKIAHGEKVSLVRDNLEVLSMLRGGRTRSSSFVQRSRRQLDSQQRLKNRGMKPSQLGALAVVPGLIFSSVGAGSVNPAEQGGSLADPASTDPSASTQALWNGKPQYHPATAPQDMQDWQQQQQHPQSQSHLTPPQSPSAAAAHRRSPSTSSKMSMPPSPVEPIPEDEEAAFSSGGRSELRPPQP